MRKTLLLFFLLPFFATAQDGALDATFGTSGVAKAVLTGSSSTAASTALNPSDITKMVVQPDGKIVQVGYKNVGTTDNFIVIRYTVDGIQDFSTFGNNYPYGFTDHDLGGQDRAHGVALQSDGKIVVVGETTISGENVIAVTRYTSGGLVDATFGGGDGIITTDLTPSSVGACGANSVKIDGADNIYVAGWSKQGTNSDFVLLKYSGTDGSLISRVFSDFAGGNDSATDLSIHLDKVYLCGTAKNGGQNYFGIASFTTSLSPNSTFNFGSPLITSIQGIGRSLVVNHVIYMTGISNNTGALEFTTASYELNGNENSTFGGGVVSTDINGSDDYSRSILLQCDGKIVVGIFLLFVMINTAC
jgi:uncharacterized delta-60 repeat protein